MTEPEVFIRSDQELVKVVGQIKDGQWGTRLPEWFQLGRTQDRAKLTLKDIINYHAYDESWVPEVLAGKTIQEVGEKYDGDLLGKDPKASFRKIADKAQAAVKNLDDLDKTVHLTYGDFPAREYLKHITSFRFFRAIDIARLIGANDQLPKDLVQAMWEQTLPDVEQWRQMGVYQEAIDVPEGAPLQQRLLGLVGRPPKA